MTMRAPSPQADETVMQLFVEGPTWGGNLISKADRDELVQIGFVNRYEGWNFLTRAGLAYAVDEGTLQRVRGWVDQRWYRKGRTLP